MAYKSVWPIPESVKNWIQSPYSFAPFVSVPNRNFYIREDQDDDSGPADGSLPPVWWRWKRSYHHPCRYPWRHSWWSPLWLDAGEEKLCMCCPAVMRHQLFLFFHFFPGRIYVELRYQKIVYETVMTDLIFYVRNKGEVGKSFLLWMYFYRYYFANLPSRYAAFPSFDEKTNLDVYFI